jgi:hypothetical protein
MTSKRALERAELMQAQIAGMEADYRRILRAALRECAEGKPGLFGRNEHIRQGLKARPPVVNELLLLGEEIDRLRKRFGLKPFKLAGEFQAARGKAAPDAPSEPRQAHAWLARKDL